jgi:hypothetical protein
MSETRYNGSGQSRIIEILASCCTGLSAHLNLPSGGRAPLLIELAPVDLRRSHVSAAQDGVAR